MPHKSKGVKKVVKGYAVMNLEQECPCVETDAELYATASAIYFSDIPGRDKRLARRYLNRNKLRESKEIKIIPVEISYTYPLKAKKK